MANQMLGQPRDFFGVRDVDLLHNWSSDLCEYDLPANLETFIVIQKQLAQEHIDREPVLPDMLNDGQRLAYNSVVDEFHDALERDTDMPGNVIVMGKGGVGKSFLI